MYCTIVINPRVGIAYQRYGSLVKVLEAMPTLHEKYLLLVQNLSLKAFGKFLNKE